MLWNFTLKQGEMYLWQTVQFGIMLKNIITYY